MLFDAIKEYTKQPKRSVIVFITGKGPMKEHYCNLVKAMLKANSIKHIRIEMMWLSIEDYPLLLGINDNSI